MKKYRNYIIIALIAAISLAVAFYMGEDSPKSTPTAKTQTTQSEPEKAPTVSKEAENVTEKATENTQADVQTEPAAENEKTAETADEPQQGEQQKTKTTCTLSVTCANVLDRLDDVSPEKASIIPKDGIIFAEKEVEFYDGESVFNVLLREMKKNKIHMEFVKTPVYKSAYIEGIANIYEFDFGETSGWLYKVNGEIPNFGCSRYKLKDGDKIEWIYTCNLGTDSGGGLQKDE